MFIMQYIKSVPFSEQTVRLGSDLSTRVDSRIDGVDRPPPDCKLEGGLSGTSASNGSRERLVKHAILRDQVQAAIQELIRGYEVTTGFAVVRVNYDGSQRRFTLDALPPSKCDR
jgi:hypothetical protein